MRPNRLLELLTPSGLGVLTYVVASIAALIASNWQTVSTRSVPPDLRLAAQTYASQVLAGHQSGSLPQRSLNGFNFEPRNLLTISIWVAVGIGLYFLFWLHSKIITGMQNNIVIGTTFTSFNGKPSSRAFWANLLLRGLVRFGAVAAVLILVIFTFDAWYPLSKACFTIWYNHLASLPHAIYLIAAVIGWVAVLHICTVLLRLSILRTRLFSS